MRCTRRLSGERAQSRPGGKLARLCRDVSTSTSKSTTQEDPPTLEIRPNHLAEPSKSGRRNAMTTTQDGASRLKAALWECAEILRGSAVDRTDWKAYILPLLFFKRISTSGTRRPRKPWSCTATSTPSTSRRSTASSFPEGCHWRDVRETARQRRRCAGPRDARDRARQSRHALPRLRRRRLGQPEILTDEILKDLSKSSPRSRSATTSPSAPTCSATPTST